jgi:asparagine synthase (glutamine-hydrolysing)
MSHFMALFCRDGRTPDDAGVEAMLRALRSRGGSDYQVHRDTSFALAVVRHDWELSEGLSGDVLVLEDGTLLVAADASLYYREDLAKKLASAGVQSANDTPSHLIAAAYRAWGEDCTRHLEGDFAFVIYDRATGAVHCGRDFMGMRTLYYAQLPHAFAVSTSVNAIVAHPECPRDLNLASLGATATGMLFGSGADSVYAAVRSLAPASSMRFDHRKPASQELQIDCYWQPPAEAATPTPFDAAADHLRGLLADAVCERMDRSKPTGVWMSGGYDSTAVFAAGMHRLRESGSLRELLPVCISYPPGDLGREDELISNVARFWESPIHWLQIDDIPLFEDIEAGAARREQPSAPLYERWNRALAQGSRDCGARIALDGNGGDQLFRASEIYLSDLFRSGHWACLIKELWPRRKYPRAYLFKATILPTLPRALLGLAKILRGGRPLRDLFAPEVHPWVRPEFVAQHRIVAREFESGPATDASSRSRAELEWYVTNSMTGYAMSVLRHQFIDVGVEVRSPLLDRRVVEFALTRPRSERVRGLEGKRLLRRAMRGLLPEAVLAPRLVRSGVTISYSRRSAKQGYPALFAYLLRSPLRLEEMGVIDGEALREAISRFERGDGEEIRVGLFHTLQTELWLRAHLRSASEPGESSPVSGNGYPAESNTVSNPNADKSSAFNAEHLLANKPRAYGDRYV